MTHISESKAESTEFVEDPVTFELLSKAVIYCTWETRNPISGDVHLREGQVLIVAHGRDLLTMVTIGDAVGTSGGVSILSRVQ
jgi:hypothetical protein